MASARVVSWPGGVTEVQLPRRRKDLGGGSESDSEEDTAALVRAAVEQAAALERGELRRVRKPPQQATAARASSGDGDSATSVPHALAPAALAAPGTPPEARAGEPRRRTTATDYAGFELALRGSGVDDDSDCDATDDDEWELQSVTPEERAAEEARRVALATAEEARERGNACFKRGDFAAAHAAYTAGLRHAPGAALLSNRAAAALALGRPGDTLRDARSALRLDPGHLKAAVRAARALQALGQADAAAAEARAALQRAPRDGDLKRLARELEAAAAQAGYERGLLRCAAAHRSGDAASLSQEETALNLPPGASASLAAVASAVESALAAAAGDAGAGRALSGALPKLREVLRAQPRCRDALAASGGVAALLAAYAEDNAGVLASLAEACVSDRCSAALAQACDAPDSPAVATLTAAFRDRRVAVITPAVQLLAAAAPASRAVRAALCAEPHAETVALMVLRAPPPLAAKVLAMLAAHAAADARALAAAMAPHAVPLAEALARAMAGPPQQANPAPRAAAPLPPSQPQRHAVAVASALASASAVLRDALAANPAVSGAVMRMLKADASQAPATRRLDFASGAVLTWRAWSGAPPDALAGLAATSALASRLAGASLAAAWDAADGASGDAWAQMLPLLTAPADVAVPAVRCLAACAQAEPACSAALAELGIAELAMDLIPANGTTLGGDAAAALLRACAAHAALSRELLSGGAGDDARGLPRACALLTSHGASHAAVQAAASAVLAATQADDGALRYISEQRPRFAAQLVSAWFARSASGDAAASARDAIEAVIVACLSSDAGAAALARDADSDEHILGFVATLRSRRAVAMARRTGGASMLNPAAVGMATPYAAAAPGAPATAPHGDAERGAVLKRVDAAKLARYIATLLPSTAAISAMTAVADSSFGGGGTVVLDLSGGGGALAAGLAAALPGATVYVAERSRGACDAATALRAPNLAPLFVGAGASCSLDAMPLPAHAAVGAHLSALLEDDDEAAAMLTALAAKLREGGALVVVEEEPEGMTVVRAAAEAAGFATVAAPEVLNAHFVCVMRPKAKLF